MKWKMTDYRNTWNVTLCHRWIIVKDRLMTFFVFHCKGTTMTESQQRFADQMIDYMRQQLRRPELEERIFAIEKKIGMPI